MTPEQQKKFKYWQWRTIIGTMIGYIFFYLIRKNFSFAMPGLTAEYGITKASLGIILSLGGFLYGVSKLVNGMLADRVNGRWHMVVGLIGSTLTAFGIGFGTILITKFTGVAEGSTADFVSKLVLLISVFYILNQLFRAADSLLAADLSLVGYQHRSWLPRCRFGTPRTRLVLVWLASSVYSLWV